MPRNADRGVIMGCLPTGGRGRPTSPPRPTAVAFEEASTSAASTSVGSGAAAASHSHDGRSMSSTRSSSSSTSTQRAPAPAAAASVDKPAWRVREDDDDAVRSVSLSTDAPRAKFLNSMVIMGCLPTGGRGRPTSPPRPTAVAFEEASTSAASTSVGSGSPPSSASTSSPAFLDEVDPLYPDDAAEAQADAGGLSTAIASRRFFLEAPGRSNSIVGSYEHAAAAAAHSHDGRSMSSARSSSSSTSTQRAPAPAAAASVDKPAWRVREDDDDAVRSVSVSTDAPRAEFLKSMVEMAEALELDPRRGADRARLHDLLLCYIALNDSDALRDILGAFTELCLLNGNNATTGDVDGTAITPPATATAERARHR